MRKERHTANTGFASGGLDCYLTIPYLRLAFVSGDSD